MTLLGNRLIGLAIVIAAALLLGGCASPKETAIFVTKTSFSLFDVDTAPAGVSIAYDRVEGYIGPRFDDGTIFPVVAVLETQGEGFGRTIKQVYATGKAALIVTTQGDWIDGDEEVAADGQDNKVVLFGTDTLIGIKLGFADGTPALSSFTLGYKRKEASLIPVDKLRQPSVLATFDNGSGVQAGAAGAKPELAFGVEQYFATGRAADNLAQNGKIRAHFRDKAEQSMGEVQKYRNEEARQARLALDTLACLARVDNSKLDMVWNSADALGVLSANTIAQIRAAAPDAPRQRDVYTGGLRQLNADSASYTALLDLHLTTVCKLASPRT